MKNLEQYSAVKKTVVGIAIFLSLSSGANAASVSGGNLVVNLDQSVFNSFGVAGGINTIIEHYFDQPTANASTGTQLIQDNLDHLEIAGDYSNLNFGINEFDTRLGPIIGTNHQLQGTTLTFDDPNSPSGQIGFGGVLRLGFTVAGTAIDSGFGEIAIGDFALSKSDRSAGAADASGWVFTTTTGLIDAPFTAGSLNYYPLWDTKDLVVAAGIDSLSITGNLLWTPEAVSFLGAFGGPTTPDAGNFALTATTTSVVPVPAAVWLFGTGLIGLVGIGRSKKQAS